METRSSSRLEWKKGSNSVDDGFAGQVLTVRKDGTPRFAPAEETKFVLELRPGSLVYTSADVSAADETLVGGVDDGPGFVALISPPIWVGISYSSSSESAAALVLVETLRKLAEGALRDVKEGRKSCPMLQNTCKIIEACRPKQVPFFHLLILQDRYMGLPFSDLKLGLSCLSVVPKSAFNTLHG